MSDSDDSSSDENLSREQIESLLRKLATPKPKEEPQRPQYQLKGNVIRINKYLNYFEIHHDHPSEEQRNINQHSLSSCRRRPPNHVVNITFPNFNTTLTITSTTSRIYLPFSPSITYLPCLNDFVNISNIRMLKEISRQEYYPKRKRCRKTKRILITVIAVIDQESIISNITPGDYLETKFLWFIQQHRITQEELLLIDKSVIKVLEKIIREGDELLMTLEAIYNTELVKNVQSRETFRVQAKLPGDIKYANATNSDVYSSFQFDQLSAVNVYFNKINEKLITNNITEEIITEFLFGIMFIHSHTGDFILRAYDASIKLKFIDYPEMSVNRFNNCLTLITNYKVFTEIFAIDEQPILIYALVHPRDVVIIKENYDKVRKKLLYEIGDMLPNQYKESYYFEIIKKSDVIVGYYGSTEVWMEVLFNSWTAPTFKSIRMFFILTGKLFTLSPILKEHHVYKLYTDGFYYGDPQMYKELPKNVSRLIILVDKNTVFQETSCPPKIPQEIIRNVSVAELKSIIANVPNQKQISFEIKIDRKMYQKQSPNFSSFFPKRHQKDLQFFGNVGEFQQRLIFYEDNNYVDLYLANRDNHVFPLGLVKDMTIRAKHVQVNKGKYIKSTVFTTFDIIGYHPKNIFTCTNLAIKNIKSWNWRKTSPSLLGLQYHIPTNTVMHGKIIFNAVYDLNIGIICINCKKPNYFEDGCIRCNSTKLDIAANIVFTAFDGSCEPPIKIETDSLDFLLEVVQIKPALKEMFLRALQRYGPVNIDLLKVPINFRDPKSLMVESLIRKFRETINFHFPILLDVVAIKMNAIDYGRNTWRLMRHRFISPPDYFNTKCNKAIQRF